MDNEPQPNSDEELMICPACHAPNAPVAGRCVECNMPLSGSEMFQPMAQIEVEGMALREATFGKPSLILVIGMWVLLSPVLIGFGCILVVELTFDYTDLPDRLTSLLLPAVICAFCTWVLFKSTTNYWRRRREVRAKNYEPPH